MHQQCVESNLENQSKTNNTQISILVIIIAVVILAWISLSITFYPPDVLQSVFLRDDAFYTLTVAVNFAQGNGITYGSNPTNGIQPLYMFLIVPFVHIVQGDRGLILMFALIMLILFHLASL